MFSNQDPVMRGYLFGVAICVLALAFDELLSADAPDGSDDRAGGADQPADDWLELPPAALDRLEDGGTVRVERWHGGYLVLSGHHELGGDQE